MRINAELAVKQGGGPLNVQFKSLLIVVLSVHTSVNKVPCSHADLKSANNKLAF